MSTEKAKSVAPHLSLLLLCPNQEKTVTVLERRGSIRSKLFILQEKQTVLDKICSLAGSRVENRRKELS